MIIALHEHNKEVMSKLGRYGKQELYNYMKCMMTWGKHREDELIKLTNEKFYGKVVLYKRKCMSESKEVNSR